MDLGLNGKVAIIGGASKGLGRACAQVLAEEGAKVAICSRTAADSSRPPARSGSPRAPRSWPTPPTWTGLKTLPA